MESTTYKTMELQWKTAVFNLVPRAFPSKNGPTHFLREKPLRTRLSSFDSFANIFMAYIETTTLSKTIFKTTVWKSYVHNIFSLWDMSKPDIEAFIVQANLHQPTVKFTAETSAIF